jgi:hypothetical protein
MDHENSRFKVLSQEVDGYIGFCECCGQFNFAYKTVLLTFTEDDFHRFFDWLISNRYAPEHYAPLQHGRTRMYASPHSNLFLTYAEEELDAITHLYQQALLILEAQRILSRPNLRS